MTEQDRRLAAAAELLVIAAAAHVAMMSVKDPNWPIFREVLQRATVKARGASRVAKPVVIAAEDFAFAATPAAQDLAQTRLHAQVRQYFARAAADRLERFEAIAGEVIDHG